MRTRSMLLLALGWAGVLALGGWFIHRELRVSGDLRLFMPAPHTAVERLLLEEVSEGPASRLLLVALEGASPAQLAESSRLLSARLRADPAFRLVANGDYTLDAVPDRLWPYRYLLSPTLDAQRLDAPFLRAQLEERERDLASPAAGLLEPILPRDPTLEVLKLLESWEPVREPQQLDEVWFNGRGDAALMLVETTAPAFDPPAQRLALEKLQDHFRGTRTDPRVEITVSGPGAFAVLMQGRSEKDAELAGILDTTGMVLLMLIAYRRLRFVILGALPLATAGVAALTAVAALFGTVHGITIAFGFTLIGVALDYPIYLFSNQLPGEPPLATARRIWPTLAVAVAGVCIAYLAFLTSGVAGLAQLACFNVAGIAAAGLTTRYLLPRLLAPGVRDCGSSALARGLARFASALPRPRWVAALVLLSCAAIFGLVRGPLWQNDLSTLTPVPPSLLIQYDAMRRELGAPDVRYLLAVDGASAQEVLAQEEQLRAALEALRARGAIAGFDDAARYLPSIATQQRRQAALPASAQLATALEQASRGLAFRPGLFAPFVRDVESARVLAPLTPAGLAGTPLELTVGGLLFERAGRWTGLVTFNEVHEERALARLASQVPHLTLLDLKQASEDMVARQRHRILWSIAVAALLLAGVVLFSLRSGLRAARVLTPLSLSTLLTIALLHLAGQQLNLFHLVSLVLAAGLGLDYGVFLERSAHDPLGLRRTLHAVAVCAAAACVVFAVLASSALPVLRSIGLTVVLGVLANFVLALSMVQPQRESACSSAKPSPH